MTANTEHAQVDVAEAPGKVETGISVERRELLRRFGVYAAVTAPAMTVLLASRQSQAGGFSRNGHANHSGNSGLGGHSGGGGGGGGGLSLGGGGSGGGGGGGLSLGGGGGCGFSC
ncbi:MAG: hypothetical protein ACJ8H8_18470 [Geminicoccaceae bacterium]|jgi:hypothetical protein